MTKRITHIVFACFFAVMSIGATVDMHFCAGELYDMGIIHKAESCCSVHAQMHSCCHTEAEGGGCEDESILMGIEDDYTPVQLSEVQLPSVADVQFLIQFFSVSTPETVQTNYPVYTNPPPLTVDRRLAYIQTYLI